MSSTKAEDQRQLVHTSLMASFEKAPFGVRAQVLQQYKLLDEKQREALYYVLCTSKRVVAISGPAGSGNTALLKILALMKKDDVAIVTPTHGARRADQEVVDKVLPRLSFKPNIEVTTTFTGFGVCYGEEWGVANIVSGIRRGDVKRGKASETYKKEIVIADEAAQMHFGQLDTADQAGPHVNGGRRQRFVLLMDGVQTPPVIDRDVDPLREMIWEGRLFQEAERDADLVCCGLKTVYRTGKPELLHLGAALRNEDFDTAWPIVLQCAAQPASKDDLDVVHDNSEIYDVAEEKFSSRPGVQVARARCESGGPNEVDLLKWPRTLRTRVREAGDSKMLEEVYVYPGQRVHYNPLGGKGARTGNVEGRGWFLSKGEPMDVVRYHTATRQLEVTCPSLKGEPRAWIAEEFIYVDLGDEYGSVKLWAPAYR